MILGLSLELDWHEECVNRERELEKIGDTRVNLSLHSPRPSPCAHN
jgi:hypothetical protein